MDEIFFTIGTILLIAAFAVLMYLGLARSVWSKTRTKSRTKSVTDELDEKEIKLVNFFGLTASMGILCYIIQFLLR